MQEPNITPFSRLLAELCCRDLGSASLQSLQSVSAAARSTGRICGGDIKLLDSHQSTRRTEEQRTSTRRQQRGEEYKQAEAAGFLLSSAVKRHGVLPRGSALERRVEASSAVDGFGARRLSALLTELLTAQSAAEARVRCLVLLIERSDMIFAHSCQSEEEELSVQTPLRAGRPRLFSERFEEERDRFVHLVHADPPQHLLQEGQ